MSSSTLTEKGQATVPVSVRRSLGLRAGDRIEWVERDGYAEVRPANLSVRRLSGALAKWGRADKANTTDDEGLAAALSSDDDRIVAEFRRLL